MTHFIERCAHGRVVRQCRCIGPKDVRVVACPPSCERDAQRVTIDVDRVTPVVIIDPEAEE